MFSRSFATGLFSALVASVSALFVADRPASAAPVVSPASAGILAIASTALLARRRSQASN